ncbi:MAG: DUF2158 domain-containing protein, partial [Candidatus Electrothrix sp. ATG2]|nr:DUF2158 domain-containing protein [Candidatus Electrothrix sp. ATG2]
MSYIKVGDVVTLKSGGPNMTVQKIIGSSQSHADKLASLQAAKDGDVKCQWFDETDLKS